MPFQWCPATARETGPDRPAVAGKARGEKTKCRYDDATVSMINRFRSGVGKPSHGESVCARVFGIEVVF